MPQPREKKCKKHPDIFKGHASLPVQPITSYVERSLATPPVRIPHWVSILPDPLRSNPAQPITSYVERAEPSRVGHPPKPIPTSEVDTRYHGNTLEPAPTPSVHTNTNDVPNLSLVRSITCGASLPKTVIERDVVPTVPSESTSLNWAHLPPLINTKATWSPVDPLPTHKHYSHAGSSVRGLRARAIIPTPAPDSTPTETIITTTATFPVFHHNPTATSDSSFIVLTFTEPEAISSLTAKPTWKSSNGKGTPTPQPDTTCTEKTSFTTYETPLSSQVPVNPSLVDFTSQNSFPAIPPVTTDGSNESLVVTTFTFAGPTSSETWISNKVTYTSIKTLSPPSKSSITSVPVSNKAPSSSQNAIATITTTFTFPIQPSGTDKSSFTEIVLTITEPEPSDITTPPKRQLTTPTIEHYSYKTPLPKEAIPVPFGINTIAPPSETTYTTTFTFPIWPTPLGNSVLTSKVFTITEPAIVTPLQTERKRDEAHGNPTLVSSTPAASPCTTTIFRATPLDLSPTSTAYPRTITKISHVDCGGCALQTINPIGLGPEVIYTTTITAATALTQTALRCSPSVVIGTVEQRAEDLLCWDPILKHIDHECIIKHRHKRTEGRHPPTRLPIPPPEKRHPICALRPWECSGKEERGDGPFHHPRPTRTTFETAHHSTRHPAYPTPDRRAVLELMGHGGGV